MPGLQGVEWETSAVEPKHDAELERAARRHYGVVPPYVPYVAHSDWVSHMLIDWNPWDAGLAHLGLDMADLIFLAVSQDASCRYCYASMRAQLRILGFDDDRIRRLEQDSLAADDDPRDRVALDYARRISQSNPAPSLADRERLREAGYSPDEIREIVYMACYTVGGNRMTTVAGIPAESTERLPDRWWVKLLQPLLKRRVSAHRRKGRPEPLPASCETGPYAYLARALDGLPCAPRSHGMYEAAFGSDVLPARCKALIFAVIARALGSRRAEEEAVALAESHGLAKPEVEEILTHLGSPRLDALEALLVPFARETIRVRPVDIQRRARQLLERLSPEQFIELVGTVALANGAARMSLALVEAE
jgi:alkylhydroperoxidase family enzyme